MQKRRHFIMQWSCVCFALSHRTLVQIMAWCLSDGKPLSEWKIASLSRNYPSLEGLDELIHLPLLHIRVGYWVSIGSDNGLSPARHRALIWTNADILLIRPQGTYFNGILFEIQIFSFKKMRFNISSVKYRPFCLHYNDAIIGVMASQITSLTIVYSSVYSSADQIKHESSASLTFVTGDRWIPCTKVQ